MAWNFIKVAKPSSKPQTLTKTPDAESDPPPENNKTKSPYIPFIDRISLVLPILNEQDAIDIHSGIWSNFKDTEVFKTGKAGGEFKVGKRIVLDCITDPKKRPLLQYAYDKETHKALKMRLEFVPVDLGPIGLDQLHAVLISMVPDGWSHFVEHAHITRLDVTVDMPGIRMDGFLLLPLQALSSMQFWTDGKLTSITHGKTGGDQTLIYNRTKKRLAKGQTLPGPTQIRVERRLVVSGGKKLEYLETMPNPFAKLQMVESLPGPPPDEKPERWLMFEDSVKARGLAAALALLPVERRTQYRKHLAAHPTPWWNPGQSGKTGQSRSTS